MKFIKFLTINNKEDGGCNQKYFYEKYFKQIQLSNNLKKDIKNKIDAETDFAISIPNLKLIDTALHNKIDDLINNKDFNPLKKELREKYPQYNNYPITYKGKKCYLYT